MFLFFSNVLFHVKICLKLYFIYPYVSDAGINLFDCRLYFILKIMREKKKGTSFLHIAWSTVILKIIIDIFDFNF